MYTARSLFALPEQHERSDFPEINYVVPQTGLQSM